MRRCIFLYTSPPPPYSVEQLLGGPLVGDGLLELGVLLLAVLASALHLDLHIGDLLLQGIDLLGENFDLSGELIDLGVEAGVVEKSGSWYSYGTERIGQGRENAKGYLRENPDVAHAIESTIRENAGLKPLDAAPSKDSEEGENGASEAGDAAS